MSCASDSFPNRKSAIENPKLLDHPVRPRQHAIRNREIELFGGFKVDDEFKFGCLLDRQIARFRTFQNFVHVDSRTPKYVVEVSAIGHEAAFIDKLLLEINGGESI